MSPPVGSNCYSTLTGFTYFYHCLIYSRNYISDNSFLMVLPLLPRSITVVGMGVLLKIIDVLSLGINGEERDHKLQYKCLYTILQSVNWTADYQCT